MSTAKITAKDLAAIKAKLAVTLGHTPSQSEMKAEVARLREAAAAQSASTIKPATVAAARKAAAKAEAAKPATPKKVARVLPPAPQGWVPSESPNGALRYTRRSKATGHVVDGYNLDHPRCPASVSILGLGGDHKPSVSEVVLKDVAGEGRWVIVDRNTGATGRSNSWVEAYAISRYIDGQPAPLGSKYIARYLPGYVAPAPAPAASQEVAAG